jgi:cardiolipin synthase (CMP-forming)
MPSRKERIVSGFRIRVTFQERTALTLANKITFFRLFMIPVFVVLIYSYTPDRVWCRHVALVVYFFSAVSDSLDGFLARRMNQQTRLGARLDPLADKLIVNLGFVFLAANPYFNEVVPMWFPAVILGRDVAIVMGAWTINEFFGPVKVLPRVLGKATTVFQMSTLIGVLLGVGFADWLLFATVVLTVLSFADYLYAGTMQVLRRKETDAGKA